MTTRGFGLAPAPGPSCDIGEGCTFDDSVRWGENVTLSGNVHIGPGAILHDGVEVGEGSWIGPHVSLGEPTMGFYRDRASYRNPATRLGAGALVRKGCVIGAGTVAGAGFQTGPNVAVRERVTLGLNVSLGNNTDVQHDVVIGDFTRLHSNVTVGSDTRIGPYCWVHPNVIFTNDRLFPIFSHPEPPVVAPFTVIAVDVTILPGARLGVHVVVGAGSEVGGDVPAFSFLKGRPAERVIDARRMVHRVDGKPFQPYPWIRHVGRDYPWKDVPPGERRVEDYVPEEWRGMLA